MNDKIKAFGARVEAEYQARLRRDYPSMPENCIDKVSIKPGKKYVKVDVGSSGKYMVDLSDGVIYGIKAYGVIHRGHIYGTLDTIDQWDWSGYEAVKKTL